MPFYVYILQSETTGTFYKGYTSDIEKRLDEHNFGSTRYSASKRPWKLVYLEELPSKKEAIIRENQIKRYNSDYLKKLIDEYQLSMK